MGLLDLVRQELSTVSTEEINEKKLDPDNIPPDREDNKEFEPVDTKVVHTDEEYDNAFSEMNVLTTESDSI